MSTHNKCFHGEIRKILRGYPLLSEAGLDIIKEWYGHKAIQNFIEETEMGPRSSL